MSVSPFCLFLESLGEMCFIDWDDWRSCWSPLTAWLFAKSVVWGWLVTSLRCLTASDSDWLDDNDADRTRTFVNTSPSLLVPPDSEPVLSLNIPVMVFRMVLDDPGNSAQPLSTPRGVHCILYFSATCWWVSWLLNSGSTENTWQEQFTVLCRSILLLFWACQLFNGLITFSGSLLFLVTIPKTLLSSEQSAVKASDFKGYVTTDLFSLSTSCIPVNEISMTKILWTFCCALRRRTQLRIAVKLAAGKLDAAGNSIEPK